MTLLYAPPLRGYKIYYYSVYSNEFNYDRVVNEIRREGFDPYMGCQDIAYVYELMLMNEIFFPYDQGFIVGLAERGRLFFEVHPSEPGYPDTILFRFPIIMRTESSVVLSHSWFSLSNAVNNFSSCYVLCRQRVQKKKEIVFGKRKLKRG